MAEAPLTRTIPSAEPGSFRDWDGRVFASDGEVLRALSETALEDWHRLSSTRLFDELTSSGRLVKTVVADDEALRAVREADPAGGWAAALKHERAPFLSYPYEWPFSMLKDAALLQLELTSSALAEGLMLKDASPYNVQWQGSSPLFIDVGSFERYRSGEPWVAYRQFCMLYLFPLMLEAYRGVAFQPWLRGRVDGISPADMRALFGWRDVRRSGVFKHVLLHASLESRYADRGGEAREELAAAGFDSALVQKNVERMTELVGRLRSRKGEGSWRDYDTTCSYADADTAAKEDFVRRAVRARRRKLVWDLGCNEGRFSRIAAESAELTVALDSDATVVDVLYRSLRSRADRSILPLVVDLADPSPSIGWRNRERSTLRERGTPGLVLCLALVHHLSISNNVPLREIVAWLADLESELVVEFPDREDGMVKRLLATKRPGSHPDYARETFERLLDERFETVDSLELGSGTRTLYFARPR